VQGSVFQFAGVFAVIAFAAASLPLYVSSTGRRLQVFGVHLLPAGFGPDGFILTITFWLIAVVCLILSLARRERRRWISAFLLASLLALPGLAVVAFGTH
jgi:hypothetical protein